MSSHRTITLHHDEDGWTAIDEETGVECSGEHREEVLAALDDAVAVSFDGESDGEDPELDFFEE